MGLALLDRAMHDLEHFGAVAFHSAPTCSQSDERRRLTSQDGIFAAVDAEHEVLDRGRAQADQAIVLCTLALLVQVQSEAVVLNFIVLFAHQLQEVEFFVALLLSAREAVLLVTRNSHGCVRCVLSPAEKVIQLLVKVLLILDRLDAAVFDFDVAIVLDDEATDGASLRVLRLVLLERLAGFATRVRSVHVDGLTRLLQVVNVLGRAERDLIGELLLVVFHVSHVRMRVPCANWRSLALARCTS